MDFGTRLAIFVEAHAGKAIAEFRKVGDAAKKAGTDADGGAKGLGRFGIAGQTAGNLLKKGVASVGIAAAGAAIIKFAADGVAAFMEVTGEIRKFQRVTGASAEDASKFVAVLHALGIEPDLASNAIFKLSTRIGANNKQLADSGIIIAKTKAGNVDLVGTILNVGDAYKATADESKKANIVAAAFGNKQGIALLPLLGKTRAELEAIIKTAEGRGLIFNQEQIDKAKEFSIATRELGESFKGLQVAVGEKIVPFLSDLAVVMTKVNDAGKEGDNGFWSGLGAAIIKDNVLGAVIKDIGDAVHWFAGEEGEAATEVARLSQEIADQAVAADVLKKAIFGATDAQHSYEAAGRSLESARRGLVDATADYNKLLKEGAVDEEKVADARRSLAEATRSLADANRGVAKAQKDYDEAVASAAALGGLDSAMDKVADAGEHLADAHDSAASALERQTEAAADLAKAKAGDPDYQQKLAGAKQRVADATQGIADAEYNLGKRSYENVAAHDAETKAIADKADQVERLKADLEAMLALNPEQLAFLAPIIAALGGSAGNFSPLLPPGSAGNTAAGPWAPILGPFITSPQQSPTSSATTTNHINVNVAAPVVDPVGIAKNIVWNLN